MAGISSISAASTASRTQFVRPAPTTTTTTATVKIPQSALSSAAQEATETLATTRKEAASGDQVAIRKLAQLQQAQNAGRARPAPKAAATNDNESDNKVRAKTESSNAAATTKNAAKAFGLDAQG